jgi:hypothetical protein
MELSYDQAVLLKRKFSHLIGTDIVFRGNTYHVEDLIIVPTTQQFYDAFLTRYLTTGNAEMSLQAFNNDKLDIMIIPQGPDPSFFFYLWLEDYARENKLDLTVEN